MEIPTIDELKALGMTQEQAEAFIDEARNGITTFTKDRYIEIAKVLIKQGGKM